MRAGMARSSTSTAWRILISIASFMSFLELLRPSMALNCGDLNYEVTQTTFDGKVADVAWMSNPAGSGGLSGFLLTDTNSVWRSDDAGASWKLINDDLDEFSERPDHDCIGYCTGAVGLVLAEDKSVLFIVGLGGRLWVAQADGTYDYFRNNNTLLYQLFPHPIKAAVVLATHVTACCWSTPGTCSDCKAFLSVSENYGESWTRVESYIVPGDFGVTWLGRRLSQSQEQSQQDDGLSSEAFLYTHFTSKIGDERSMRVSSDPTDLTLVTSYAQPHTTVTVVSRGIGAFVAGKRAFAIQSDILKPSRKILLSSLDGLTFSRQLLPQPPDSMNFSSNFRVSVPDVESLQPLLELESGAAFIAAGRVWNTPQTDTDVYKIFTNRRDVGISPKVTITSINHGGEFELFAASSPIGEIKTLFANRYLTRDSDHMVSIVSFDEGESWFYPGPSPNSADCTDGGNDPEADKVQTQNAGLTNFVDSACQFHFRRTPRGLHFADATKAPGVLLATGNVGPKLSLKPDDLNAYLSRDGGATWKNVRDGSNLVAMSSGAESMLIMTDDEPTSEFVVSVNGGSQWRECGLFGSFPSFNATSPVLSSSGFDFWVQDSLPDPTNSVPRYLLLGVLAPKNSSFPLSAVLQSNHTLIHLLLKPQVNKTCVYPDDYETFSVLGTGTAGCFNGRRLISTRKKASVQCEEPTQLVPPPVWENCTCSAGDYVCDDCFVLNSRTHGCDFDRAACPTHQITIQARTCTGSFELPFTGFKRSENTSCVLGVNLSSGWRRFNCDYARVDPPPPERPRSQEPEAVDVEKPGITLSAGAIVAITLASLATFSGIAVAFYYAAKHLRTHYVREELDEDAIELPHDDARVFHSEL